MVRQIVLYFIHCKPIPNRDIFVSFGKCLILPSPCPVQTDSRFELHCSSDIVHIRTCSDSCAALMNLIQYIASYGDLHAAEKVDRKPGAPQRKTKVQHKLTLPPATHVSDMLMPPRLHDCQKVEKKLKRHLSVLHLHSDGIWKGDSMGLFGKAFSCLVSFVSEH